MYHADKSMKSIAFCKTNDMLCIFCQTPPAHNWQKTLMFWRWQLICCVEDNNVLTILKMTNIHYCFEDNSIDYCFEDNKSINVLYVSFIHICEFDEQSSKSWSTIMDFINSMFFIWSIGCSMDGVVIFHCFQKNMSKV